MTRNRWLESDDLQHVESILCKLTGNEDLRDAIAQVFRRLKAAENTVEQFRERDKRRLAKEATAPAGGREGTG